MKYILVMLTLLSISWSVFSDDKPGISSDRRDESKNSYSISAEPKHGIEFTGMGALTVASEIVSYLKAAAMVDPSIAKSKGSGSSWDPSGVQYKFGSISGSHWDSAIVHPQQAASFHTLIQSIVFSNYKSGKQEVEVRLDKSACEDLFNLMKAAGVKSIQKGTTTFYNGPNMFAYSFPGEGGAPFISCIIKFDPSK